MQKAGHCWPASELVHSLLGLQLRQFHLRVVGNFVLINIDLALPLVHSLNVVFGDTMDDKMIFAAKHEALEREGYLVRANSHETAVGNNDVGLIVNRNHFIHIAQLFTLAVPDIHALKVADGNCRLSLGHLPFDIAAKAFEVCLPLLGRTLPRSSLRRLLLTGWLLSSGLLLTRREGLLL